MPTMDVTLTDADIKLVAEEVVRQLRKIDSLEYLRPKQVQAMLGVKKSWFYRILQERPDFPKAVQLPGSRVRVWKRNEVEEWAAKEFK